MMGLDSSDDMVVASLAFTKGDDLWKLVWMAAEWTIKESIDLFTWLRRLTF